MARRDTSVFDLCHVFVLGSCAHSERQDKGSRKERPLPTSLLFNDLRSSYYRAKTPAKVVSPFAHPRIGTDGEEDARERRAGL